MYHTIDRAGRLTRSFEVEAPFPSMMHDFIVSAEHALFPIFPAIFDFKVMADSGLPISWQPERGSRLGVLPRDGSAEDVLWFEHDPCFSFHTVNAQTRGSTVVADLFVFPQAPLTEGPDAEPPTLRRWTVDLAAGGMKEEYLDDAPAEFACIDKRHAGKAYRDIFTLGSVDYPDMKGQPEGFNSLFHYNLDSGRREVHRFGVGDCAGEPCFVARSENAEEGDGYVLSIVYRGSENRSDLVIIDTQHFEAKPVAVIKMPHRVPFGFHGSWREAE